MPSLLLLAAIAAQGELLLPLNRTDGCRNTYGAGAERTLTVVTGAGQTPDGDGALRLAGTTAQADGNHYFGLMVPLAEPVDLRRRRLLLAARTDHPETTRAFYVRLYNVGEDEPCWSFSSWSGQLQADWREFELQAGVSFGGLVWEPERVGRRVAERADRLELIIGTGEDNAAISLLADSLRVAPPRRGLDDLGVRAIDRRGSRLVSEGRPAAVVLHPDSAAGQAAAARVVAAVRERTGVELPARPGRLADRPRGETIIALGGAHTNPALELPYARMLTPVDRLCPGPGGMLLHTIGDPEGSGHDLIVAGASDEAGLTRAAEALAARLAALPAGGELALPRLFERGYSAEFLAKTAWADDPPDPEATANWTARAQKALDEGAHRSIAGVLDALALRYQLTADPHLAKAWVAVWDLYAAAAVADPSRFGGPWGFDSDFASWPVVCGWDNLEEDPALSDEERLRATRHLARWLREAVIPSCHPLGDRRTPHNHETFPGLGALAAGLYFSRHYPEAWEGPQWLGIADSQFQSQAGQFKPYEDCNGYQWLTVGHLLRYAVARPDFTVFDNGIAQKMIDYCLGTMNNLGYQVPFGDTGPWQCWNNELLCLDIHAHRTGDPGARWAATRKRANRPSPELYSFPGEPLETPPQGFAGVRVWPLEPAYYATWRADPRPPLTSCYDKVSFRAGVEAAAAYLLLDGLSNGGHHHFDGNSLPQLTWFDRIWLADNDYYKSQVKYHNSLLVFREGESAARPAYAELLGSGETSGYGYARSRLGEYAGVDWDRTVVQLKAQRAFLVLDRVVARRAGDYALRLMWHGVGRPTLTDDGLLLEQGGPTLWIQPAPGPGRRLTDDAELGANWSGYPHAEPIVRSFAETARVTLPVGGSYLFATLLHGRADGPAAPWTMRWIDTVDGVLLEREQERLAVAVGPLNVTTAAGEVATDAQLLVLDPEGVALFDARHATAAGIEGHRSETPEDVQLAVPQASLAFGLLPLREPTPTAVPALTGPPLERLFEERYRPPDGGEPVSITCLSGAPDDGERLYAGTAEGWVFALNHSGQATWGKPLGARINDVCAVDIDGDGRLEVAVARLDHRVTLLDDDGLELWSRELAFYRRVPEVNLVRAGDINGDGVPEIIAGGNNWRFYAFDRHGKELWNYETVHPSRSGAVADLDGDGRAEVLAGTHYHWSSTLRGDGTLAWRYNFGPICHAVTTAAIDGDRTRSAVYGGGDGLLHVVGPTGERRLALDTGDEVRQVAAADLEGDGREEILAASQNESLFCLGADLRRRWRVDLGAPPTALAALPGAVVAGTAEGRLLSFSPAGAVTGMAELGSPILTIVPHGGTVTVACADGRLVRLRLP